MTARRLLFSLCFQVAPRWFLGSLLVSIAAALGLSLYPYGLKLLVDGATVADSTEVVWGAVLVAGLYSVGWAAGVLGANLDFGLIDRANLHLTSTIGRQVNAVPGTAHLEQADYLRELDLLREKQPILNAFPRQVLSAVQLVVRTVAVMVLLGQIQPALAALPLAGVIPYLAERVAEKWRAAADKAANDDKRLSDRLFSVGVGAKAATEIRVFGLSDELLERYRQAHRQVELRGMRAQRAAAAACFAGWLVFGLLLAAGVGLVAVRAVHGAGTAGDLLLAMTLLRRVQLQFSQITGLTANLVTSVRAAGRLAWLMSYADTARGPERPRLPPPDALRGGLRLRGLGFAFQPAHPVLSDVDLDVPAGSVVALVGENGAGKTTLVKLLAGLYTPTAGLIELDGIDLTEVDARQWRVRMAGTLQDFQRYDLTAGHNVGLGDLPRYDDEDGVRDAVALAGACAVMDALDKGAATPLGRSFGRTAELSGGQWQKLALGRGLMRRNPLLVVFDEPTAALDPDAEQALFDRCTAAARDLGGRTGAITLLISHRFSMVRSADLIVVLAEGRVRETGTHAELMAGDGLYAELFTMQATAYR